MHCTHTFVYIACLQLSLKIEQFMVMNFFFSVVGRCCMHLAVAIANKQIQIQCQNKNVEFGQIFVHMAWNSSASPSTSCLAIANHGSITLYHFNGIIKSSHSLSRVSLPHSLFVYLLPVSLNLITVKSKHNHLNGITAAAINIQYIQYKIQCMNAIYKSNIRCWPNNEQERKSEPKTLGNVHSCEFGLRTSLRKANQIKKT